MVIGSASLVFLTATFHPGTGANETSANPGGSCTETFVVLASSCSFGTCTFSTTKAFAGA